MIIFINLVSLFLNVAATLLILRNYFNLWRLHKYKAVNEKEKLYDVVYRELPARKRYIRIYESIICVVNGVAYIVGSVYCYYSTYLHEAPIVLIIEIGIVILTYLMYKKHYDYMMRLYLIGIVKRDYGIDENEMDLND